jgi:hypothetical protein
LVAERLRQLTRLLIATCTAKLADTQTHTVFLLFALRAAQFCAGKPMTVLDVAPTSRPY